MIEAAFVVIATICIVWYCMVIGLLFRGLRSLSKSTTPNYNRFSIVIAARNEALTIERCIESIYTQTIDHARFEVIIVNDRSNDETPVIIEKLQQKYPTLHGITISEVPAGIAPKKNAIAQGVNHAQNDIVVITDADCTVQPTWLSVLDCYFSDEVGLVQGITTYFYFQKLNRLFFDLQSIDFISHGIVAASAIGAGIPINSNANNFAYRKKAFFETGGTTETIGHIVSGDDDLLLQKIWRNGRWKIRFMPDTSASVETMPSKTVPELFQQRARWGSKTIHYHTSQVILLTGIFFFYVMIICCGIGSFFDIWFLKSMGLLFSVKIAGELCLMIPGLKLYKRQKLIYVLPLASLLQLPMVLGAVIIGIFGKFTWKGQSFSRTIKQLPHRKQQNT